MRSQHFNKQLKNGKYIKVIAYFIWALSHSNHFALFLACMANGIVWSSAGSEIGRSELQYRIDALKPSLVIFNEKYTYKSMSFQASFLTQIHTTGLAYMEIGLLQQGCNKVQAKSMSFSALAYDFPSLILFTSGSTGRPKAAINDIDWYNSTVDERDQISLSFRNGRCFLLSNHLGLEYVAMATSRLRPWIPFHFLFGGARISTTTRFH